MDLLDTVGIGREFIDSFPYEFSGRQQQSVGIVRTLALNSKFIVCDEPVSSLDVSKERTFWKSITPIYKLFLLSVPKMPKDGDWQKTFPSLKGKIPSPIDLPAECRFHSHCEYGENKNHYLKKFLKDILFPTI
ncbi:MAG: hypothetical protein NZ841_04445 [Dictyoglomus sp.]|nr:hypothetical protein [Dictyoglomus sp.]MCX7942506.1 hypothetical protein [Dictyoglomaceae bacterium]MDW8188526.1 hypothetical protein [Dictyoglomus sp.]